MAMTRQEMMQELTDTVSHPQFDSLIREIQEQPQDNRLAYAQRFATPEELKERGVPLNDQFRICIRMFEDKDAPSVTYDSIFTSRPIQAGAWTVCASLGVVLCISVGYSE